MAIIMLLSKSKEQDPARCSGWEMGGQHWRMYLLYVQVMTAKWC